MTGCKAAAAPVFFIGGPGNDIIDGGPGTDDTRFARARASHAITGTSATFQVQALTGNDGGPASSS